MSVAMENRWKRRLIAENNAISDQRRQVEAMFLQRGKRPPTPATNDANPTRREVRRWMRLHASEYETATALAEGANAALCLPQEWLDDETHWVWDEAEREHES